MTQEKIEKGICKQCGCTWNTACVDEIHGACWWMDKNKTNMIFHNAAVNESGHYASCLPRKYRSED